MAKESAAFQSGTRGGFAQRSRPCHCRSWLQTKITSSWSAQSRAKRRAANVRVIDYEANLALLEPAEKSFLDGITPLEITSDTGRWRPARGLATGTDRRVAGDGRSGDDGANDALPDRCWEFPHVPRQHSTQYRENSYTVPLVKNNRSSPDCCCVTILALATARCYPGAGHQRIS